ncbi:hypothetical protein BK809_0002773 [Diplodia seriata]|uniref:RING-type domain-containing protein n=1 Tax=Diplodia seriata TaxID=420778 RepID=A0A1S8BKK5_9PEZI|nr:hypothetical protein BK809_0002773 [Diplodia seriata]
MSTTARHGSQQLQQQTSYNSSNNYLFLDEPTSWSWDAWDAGGEGVKKDEQKSCIDDDDDDDAHLAWRLQLEALEGWDDGDDGADAEFALLQQVAEIEEAEEKEKEKKVGLVGEEGDDEELALLVALEEVGGWWSDLQEEDVGRVMERDKRELEPAKDIASAKVSLPSTTPHYGSAQKSAVRPEHGQERNNSPPPATTRTTGSATAVCAVCNDPPSLPSTLSSVSQSGVGLAVLPCAHAYCAACLNNLFRAAINDPTLFPPRCCGLRVPLDSAGEGEQRDKGESRRTTNTASKGRASAGYRRFLDAATVEAFERRMARDRRMATAAEAATTVAAGTVGEQRTATVAAAATATTEVDEEFLRMAEACGWARCCGCGRFVELEYGCNHMRCCCGAHFCYACGNPWKTCDCAQWDEERLLKRATDLVAPPAAAAAGTAAVAEAPVDEDDDSNCTRRQRPTPQDTEPAPDLPTGRRRDDAAASTTRTHPLVQQRQQRRQHQRPTTTQPRQQPPSAPRAPPPLPPPPIHSHNRTHNPSTDENNANIPNAAAAADDDDDPPPPYPGPPLTPDLFFYPGYPSGGANNRPPAQPLTRAEYARLRASVRTVVDALNAVLAAMDREGEGGGEGCGGNSSSEGAGRVDRRRRLLGFGSDGERGGLGRRGRGRCCGGGHGRWVVVGGEGEGGGGDPGPGGGGDGGLEKCEGCARWYGFDIWYRRGGDGGEGEGEGAGGGVMVCEGCGVRACWFCREYRL